MTREKNDINFALVETTRPPIYTAMKYWGKKPHNIWRDHIKNYTPENGVYLDPFAGSAISVFEAVKARRKVIGFDLNPLTSFIIEVLTTNFDKELFTREVENVFNIIKNDKIFLQYYSTCSRKTGEQVLVQHFKWENGSLYEIGIIDKKLEDLKQIDKNKKLRYVATPNDDDQKLAIKQKDIRIDTWFPDEPFSSSPSFSANFIQCMGGNCFSNLWTRRNLYILSKIFDLIKKVTDKNLKQQLLFGFIQTLHLTTKMSVPRRANANRDFSTSWGRSAYICANRKMEMNPLLVFKSSCLGKQSVESALKDAHHYLGKKPKIVNVGRHSKNKDKLKGFDIKYGIVDINAITDFVPEKSVDFIMTDPPYGGLVQYLDLSSIWLNWLKNINRKYEPNYSAEITIKKGTIDLSLYQKRFTSALKNLRKILKDDGKIIFTFHNKEISIWNAFLKSISLAGFKIEKVIHQQNRRTGESNVANPYGTSGSDFYIRCINSSNVMLKTEKDEFEHFVINKATEILASRNEPTPFIFLFNGLLADISSEGFDLEDFDNNIKEILEKYIGKRFLLIEKNINKAGKLWWFINPNDHIKYPDRPLTERVEQSIVALLRRKTSITFDDALATIYKKYINGLTPDIQSVKKILEKYAVRSNGRWLYKGLEIEQKFTKHTEIIYKLIQIGKKLGFEIFVGKREQGERYKTKKRLVDYCDFKDLSEVFKDISVQQKIERLEMIDLIWIKNKNIVRVFEVENTTNLISAIQRASNLDNIISKIMVIPNDREKELKRISDPLFKESFDKYCWQYILYSDIDKILQSKLDKTIFDSFLKNIK